MAFRNPITSLPASGIVGPIPATQISGQLTDAQIAAVAAAKVTGQLTDAQIAAVAAAKVTGQLTAAQIAAVNAVAVTGQLTAAQITSLAANQITGQLTAAQIAAVSAAAVTGQLAGTQLAADSIDGKTITGATVRTAAAGSRWELTGTNQTTLTAYSGLAAEIRPAQLGVFKDLVNLPQGDGWVTLISPCLGGPSQNTAQLTLYTIGGGTDPTSQVDLTGTAGYVGPFMWGPSTAAPVGGSAISGPLDLQGALSMKTNVLPYTISGSLIANPPDATGHVAVSYGVTFAGIVQPVVSNGSSGAICYALTSVTATGFTVQLLTPGTGAPITTGGRRVNWTVSGTLA